MGALARRPSSREGGRRRGSPTRARRHGAGAATRRDPRRKKVWVTFGDSLSNPFKEKLSQTVNWGTPNHLARSYSLSKRQPRSRPALSAMAPLSKLYLLCYNSLQSLGWFIAFLRLLPCLAPPISVHSAYSVVGELICLLQTCAILETVHAAIGLVPTAPLLAFLQWGGRTHFALAVVRQIPEVQSSLSVFITFIAWSISEVIRYSHYALTTLRVCPAWLTYLRYTAFIPLYPIGVGPGEMWTIYQALPFVKERNLYSDFFEKFSMSYHSFLVGVLVCYPFLWLKLYMHVFKQRKSKLGKVDRKKRV